MLDLLAAGDARRDPLDVGARGLHGGSEAAVSEGDREGVVLRLKAEGPRHPAAAGIHLLDVEACPPERGHSGRRPHQRLLMAVAVEEPLPAIWAERKGHPLSPLAVEELFQEEALLGHPPRGGAPQQIHVLVTRGEQARRLQPHQGHPPPCLPAQLLSNSASSSRRVSGHDGSSPTMATPRSAYGRRRSTFQAAWALASASMPLEISGRPQHFLSTSLTA